MGAEKVTITIETSPTMPHLKIITLRGTIDTRTLKHIDEKVLPVLENEESKVIFDVSDLDFFSSVGVLFLKKYLLLLQYTKKLIMLVKPSKPSYYSTAIFGFRKKFYTYDRGEAAINILR
jgi:anti-anti-sigma factor